MSLPFYLLNIYMDIRELEDFKLSDAVKFHDKLNPLLWTEKGRLDPDVRKQLLVIAEDFITELGLSNLKVDDITVSGSNASFTYTPHSDLDLHILVDFKKLPNNEVYTELFNAKKTLYNDNHEIKIRGVPVELYVQDVNMPVISLGEYSVIKDDWIKIPKKHKANLNQQAVKLKYEKLGHLIELALKTKDPKKLQNVLDVIKRYRKAGLDKTGEFGPENLAFKALRSQGYIKKLYDLKNELHSDKLSLSEILDTSAKGITWDTEDTDLITGKFTASNNIKYSIDILAPYIGPSELDPYDFFSDEQMTDQFYDRARFVEFEQVTRSYKGKQGIEGTGAAAEVFGIVVNGLLSYIKKYKPSMLYFQAVEPNRQKLYKAMCDRIVRSMPGWQCEQKGSHFAIYNTKLLKKDKVNEVLSSKSAFDLKWETHRAGLDRLDIARAQDSEGTNLAYNFWYEPKYDATVVEFSRGDNWNKQFAVSGAGEQFRVFATLLEAIRQYVANHPVQYIMFSAKEPSRARLYKALSTKYLPAMGYNLVPKGKMASVKALVKKKGSPPGHKAISAGKMPKELRDRFQEEGSESFVLSRRVTDENHNVNVQEASGYIPSEKEKNDPRFKTALTVDVKPDSIKKNAKAFGFKVSRAGIPPLLRK